MSKFFDEEIHQEYQDGEGYVRVYVGYIMSNLLQAVGYFASPAEEAQQVLWRSGPLLRLAVGDSLEGLAEDVAERPDRFTHVQVIHQLLVAPAR